MSIAISNNGSGVNKPLSTPIKISIALLTLIAVLVIMNVTINKYETHLNTGDTVLLELAPVDPRGLMQGDYMRLNFAIADDITEALKDIRKNRADDKNITHDFEYNSDGIAIVKVDDHNVAHFERLVPFESVDSFDRASLASDEMALHFRIRNGSIKFATNAFFFQEGHAKDYEAAEYGLFRVNQQGEPLLADMVNSEFEVIKGGMMTEEETE
ncbi:GDYXXLXY domain-containing protein [Psychrobacter sp. FDAARGOS_221]|uniref:GDYXXLXY domain-containing protein n=1 Tax=Psychrobacter sp. FDAARGOS_221 TaxID=1975705 RepID=UPI000BB58FC2|nr:GDYXXLXY domain-containing protein [Psychrobacter sp. FDAARGOS_221]PNK60794.1 hypothetical protein A6J60_007825 [Psychrobacter sp. FDAARGOS_221]